MSGKNERVAVIGAGIFGCNVALAIANAGYNVVLLERLPAILKGTSENNTNRVHQGFHYPRDVKTATECRDNFARFEAEFKEAIVEGFPNLYCIASEHSLTSKDDFLKFCDLLGLSYSPLDLKRCSMEINSCSLGIACKESIVDLVTLRNIMESKISSNKKISLFLNTEVTAINKKNHRYELSFLSESQSKQSFDAVVNCSYANINTLTVQLGYEVSDGQYEYTVVPIIDLDLPPAAITIMDGPFMTLFPYGNTKRFLLYHVKYSVITSEIRKTLHPDWLNPEQSPFAKIDQQEHYKKMQKACVKFLPFLANAKLCGYLQTTRLVLARHDYDDARPSLVNDHGEGYLTIFSGKIDRSLSIADSVCLKIKSYFEMQNKKYE